MASFSSTLTCWKQAWYLPSLLRFLALRCHLCLCGGKETWGIQEQQRNQSVLHTSPLNTDVCLSPLIDIDVLDLRWCLQSRPPPGRTRMNRFGRLGAPAHACPWDWSPGADARHHSLPAIGDINTIGLLSWDPVACRCLNYFVVWGVTDMSPFEPAGEATVLLR